jgi:methylmalonyl-CoA/ethylmalonyl-CoA epimerase
MGSRLEFWHHHAGVSVPDLDRAIDWYRTVLGFEVEARFPIDVIPAKVAMLKNGPLHIELFEVPNAVPASADRGIPEKDLYTHGNKHVSFAVENVKQLAVELRRRGADIVWVREMEQGANLFMRDLYGNLIEFIQGQRPQETVATLKID